jgi:hypothetical protein
VELDPDRGERVVVVGAIVGTEAAGAVVGVAAGGVVDLIL